MHDARCVPTSIRSTQECISFDAALASRYRQTSSPSRQQRQQRQLNSNCTSKSNSSSEMVGGINMRSPQWSSSIRVVGIVTRVVMAISVLAALAALVLATANKNNRPTSVGHGRRRNVQRRPLLLLVLCLCLPFGRLVASCCPSPRSSPSSAYFCATRSNNCSNTSSNNTSNTSRNWKR